MDALPGPQWPLNSEYLSNTGKIPASGQLAQALQCIAYEELSCYEFRSKKEGNVVDHMYSEEGVIFTASSVRAWYLTKFRGHRVRAVRVTPIPTILGRMAYSRRWVLVEESQLPAA